MYKRELKLNLIGKKIDNLIFLLWFLLAKNYHNIYFLVIRPCNNPLFC